MTCIVFDGTTIAADGLTTNGEVIVEKKARKLIVVGDVVIGCVGRSDDCHAFHLWAESRNGHPIPYPKLSDDFQALMVDCDGDCYVFDEKFATGRKVQAPYAIGCGSYVAYGALSVGADAIKAVNAACARHVYCGGDITHFTLGQLKQMTEKWKQERTPHRETTTRTGVFNRANAFIPRAPNDR